MLAGSTWPRACGRGPRAASFRLLPRIFRDFGTIGGAYDALLHRSNPAARPLSASLFARGRRGVSGFLIVARTAHTLTSSRLDGLAADRSALFRSYLESRELTVLTTARSETVQNAIRDLHSGWIKLEATAGEQPYDA